MVLLLFLMFIHCLVTEAYEICPEYKTGNGPRSRSMYLYKVADRVLQRHGYRNLTGIPMIHCGNLCLSDTRCFSVNYSDRDKLCELNEASASRYPLNLAVKMGVFYYGPDKPQFVRQLHQLISLNPDLPSETDNKYQTHTLASSECQGTDQHLCQPWELEEAYEAGYFSDPLPYDTGFWYSVPERQVELPSSGLAYQDLPGPLITTESYAVDDRDGMAAACSALGAHLCTLVELKEAYLRGYRQTLPVLDTWLFFSLPNRDVQLFNDGCGGYTDGECYEGVVANTPRPRPTCLVYCCPTWSVVTSPGLCCPGVVSPRDPIVTMEYYNATDRVGMVSACSALGAHLCTLAELKEAYLMGYRQTLGGWLYFAVTNWDAQLFNTGNGCGPSTGEECYEGVVANTPRPSIIGRVFCCPDLA